MPKREPTPPLDDEFKYFIVNYPYPLHANMVIPEERLAFAHWIASCIGKDNLFAIYHKPSAPNMVVIEVAKHCPRARAMLGLHKWSAFLKRPELDQADKESRIYYCSYSTGREVQKYGWKRLDVEDSWFKNYHPDRSPFISTPYPKTEYCDIPPETQVDYRLCRPLPVDLFPRPKKTETKSVTVGSAVWVNNKMAGVRAPPVVAPIPSKPRKSWANIGATVKSSPTEVQWPGTTSRTSSEESRAGVPGPPPGLVRPTEPLISPPPGLGPPPGLSAPPSQGTDGGWSSEPLSISDSAEWPTSVEVVIVNSLGSISLGDAQELKSNDDDDGQFWTEQEPRKVDWDKVICPEHRVACKSGVCQVIAKLEREKKREEMAKNGNGGGWTQTKTGGRGRGGRGRGRANGNKTSSSRGGRGRGGW